MSNEINLLPFKRKNVYKYKKFLQVLQIVSVFSLFIIVISSLLIFYYKSKLSLGNLKDEENTIIANISQLRQKKARLALTSERLQNITEIINRRPDYEYRLTKVLEQAPAGVSITNLIIDNRAISFSASSNSLYSIGMFMDNLVSMVSNKELFSKITLQYLSAGGSYNISITANLL